MAKFNVGDKVIGNENARRYSVTNMGYIGTVMRNTDDWGDDRYFCITAPVGMRGDCNVNGHPCYAVLVDSFDLWSAEREREIRDAMTCPFSIGDYVKIVKDGQWFLTGTIGTVRTIDTNDGTIRFRKASDRVAWINWDACVFVGHEGEWIVPKEGETVTCDCCGAVIEDKYMFVDGHIVCAECEERVETCEHCGKRTLSVEEFDGEYWCEDCLEELTAECECCGDRVYRDDCTRTGNGDWVCDSCLEDNYAQCCDCDEYYPVDDMYGDRYGDWYCENCWDNRNTSIHDYYYKPTPIFHGDGPRFIGVELEIDGAGEDSDSAEYLCDIANDTDEHIYCKHDGSLDYGFEIVSHPATLEYHTENIAWQKLMTKALSMEYRSHDTSTCGLHCHISRAGLGKDYNEQEDTISKIIYFTELHWDKILRFSRRSADRMARWAQRYGIIDNDTEKTYKNAKEDGNHNRYRCINLQNEHTVEFRMFRGTLKYSTFLATLQFVDEVCTYCMEHKATEVEAMSWTDFVNTIDGDKKAELVEYLKTRGIYGETMENAVESAEFEDEDTTENISFELAF